MKFGGGDAGASGNNLASLGAGNLANGGSSNNVPDKKLTLQTTYGFEMPALGEMLQAGGGENVHTLRLGDGFLERGAAQGGRRTSVASNASANNAKGDDCHVENDDLMISRKQQPRCSAPAVLINGLPLGRVSESTRELSRAPSVGASEYNEEDESDERFSDDDAESLGFGTPGKPPRRKQQSGGLARTRTAVLWKRSYIKTEVVTW